MAWLTEPEAWIALLTLTALEIVLGIDNIIFISILTGKLPPSQQPKARTVGIMMAMITRILLLFSLTWLMRLTSPLFSVLKLEISGRDLILIIGGLFLIGKSTLEIHDKLEGEEGHSSAKVKGAFVSVIFQIMVLDIVFSFDSVITAIGMSNRLFIMVSAVVIAVIFMLFASGSISRFIEKHPTIKVLALSFLLLIGVALVGEGLDFHIPKGYIYFSMAFALFIEMINMRIRGIPAPPVKLRSAFTATEKK